MSRRTEQVGSTIRRELAQIILRDLDDPRLTGMPSITRVKVCADLSTADVYVTVMGSQGQQNAALNALRHSAGLMRSKLTRLLAMRQVPYLKFHVDEHLKKELELMNLLQRVADEKQESQLRQSQVEPGKSEDDARDAQSAAQSDQSDAGDAAASADDARPASEPPQQEDQQRRPGP